jgi:hypothetical protein
MFGAASTAADAVQAWHRALTGALAAESAEWLEARQRERGLVFGERPLCAVLRPRFLTPDQYRGLRHTCRVLLGAFATIGERALTDHRFRDRFRLSDWEAVLAESTPRLSSLAPLSRLDAFVDADGVTRITEYNAETPAGTAYSDVLSEVMLTIPAMRGFSHDWTVQPLPARHHLLNTLLETWHAFRGVRTVPTIAIVDWDDVPTASEFVLSCDYFRSMGVPCTVTTPDALRYQGGVLRDAAGTAIDLIYKRVLIHELVAERGLDHPMVRAVRDGAVCMVNPFHCKPLHKKASLAVLSDERNAAMFSREQSTAIARHVPWTRLVEERRTEIDGESIDLLPWIAGHREELVLKPNDDYGGAGIVLGWEVDGTAWDSALQRALDEPYVVQRRIDLPRENFPAVVDGRLVYDERIVDTAPFGWGGTHVDGMLCRISTSTLVNVTAGGGSTVPTYLVAPRG